MDFKQITELTPVVTGFLALVGGLIALVTYRHNLRLKRAEWMEKLHTKFYESQNYKRVRRILDYQSTPDYDNLQNAISGAQPDDDLSECFVDYLNFFEYIASLSKLGQLSQAEILMLFEYYLRLLRDRDFVWKFICEQGFENLKMLLERLPAKRST